ncbi:IclR family transcriptional regulator [Microbacterium sp. BR1]|uniref:IclR family transcriptional regulator n=1 Tax=Microbacterium sp. BR1 TaxID=1070896 RepID=UPI000C2B98DC|nr:IclR family transcriptional regulator [Microbacterium sp. BR1]
MVTEKPERIVRSVANACDILELLARSNTSRVTDLAADVGLTKASVYNLLTTLREYGLVTRDDDKKYRLGPRLAYLASAVNATETLSEVAGLYLRTLAEETGEQALVGVLDGDRVLFAARAESQRAVQLMVRTGQTEPLHATATGKVLAAWRSEAFQRSLAAHPLDAYTPRTITDGHILLQELESVRRDGYATCRQEHQEGVSGLAVPIRTRTGDVVAALALAAPVERLPEHKVASVLASMRPVADRIGHGL